MRMHRLFFFEENGFPKVSDACHTVFVADEYTLLEETCKKR
jgi:hypothetical protein